MNWLPMFSVSAGKISMERMQSEPGDLHQVISPVSLCARTDRNFWPVAVRHFRMSGKKGRERGHRRSVQVDGKAPVYMAVQRVQQGS